MSEFAPLRSRSPLIVYSDFKSPYAFAAWEPTWQLLDELAIEADWRPLTLDIPSYLGAERESGDGERSERTRGQWSQVRYAYHDARRYVALKGKVLRGTTKIWDSSLASIGLLWADAHGPDALRRYGDRLFERFWRREIDIENGDELAGLLEEVAVDRVGFEAYLSGEGRRLHDRMQQQIFDAGIFGVPTYVCEGEVLFGREHLPRVRWLLTGRRGAAPDIAYRAVAQRGRNGAPERADIATSSPPGAALRVWVDISDPYCYLAFRPTRDLAQELAIPLEWRPARARPARRRAIPPRDAPRGERHRAYRAHYRVAELQRYADAMGLPSAGTPRQNDASLAGIALAWCTDHAPEHVDGFLERLFTGYWERRLDVGSSIAMRAELAAAGVAHEGFERYAASEGQTALERSQQELNAVGVSTLPLYLLDEEPFAGRAHLPMIRWLLTGRRGPLPI